MRSLAMARYRLLTTIREARWVFLVVLVAAVGPLTIFSGVFQSETFFWDDPSMRQHFGAQGVVVVFGLHALILVNACEVFGTRRRRGSPDAMDLTETVPVTPGERFGGDALGVFAAVMSMHVCALPLLALAIALSPLPTKVFFWLELVIVAVVVLGSFAASWKLHAPGTGSRTRTIRSVALFLLLLLGIVYVTTRWQAFRDQLWFLITDASPYWWKPLAATVVNPPMLFTSLVLLYFGFIGYYTAQSIRSIER